MTDVTRVIAYRCPSCDRLLYGVDLYVHRHPKPGPKKNPAAATTLTVEGFLKSIRGVG